jgi:hypothetical protein
LLPRVLLKHMINREVINSVVISTNNAWWSIFTF